MSTHETLYRKAVKAAAEKKFEPLFAELNTDKNALDCLLNPRAYAPVVRLGPCECQDEEGSCQGICFYNAITRDAQGNAVISVQDCAGCGDCITACGKHNLTEIKEVVPVFEHISKGTSVYALIAPAYVSQFGADTSPGRLRSAFKKLGFAGMIEVALFADILTLKEALEFDKAVQKEDDFILTSCCCPMWVAMIEKVYAKLVPHMPPSISPMAACGRAVKKLHSNAVTVFIGPCIAKKAEARQKDIADAVDYVLTFTEMADIFTAAGIEPGALEEDLRDHSSASGRLYARTGGVSESVAATLERIAPERSLPLKARQANGVPECKALLKEMMEGTADANFAEGMGCRGGCVGGPRVLISPEEGSLNVDAYAKLAHNKTPVNNAFVLEMLRRLGFDTIESLRDVENMFTRHFD